MNSSTLHQAMSFHQAGKLAEAAALYQQILADDPNHADALHLLGGVLMSEKQFEHAETLIRQAVEISPEVALYRSSLAQALLLLRRYKEALVEADAALKRDEIPEALANKATSLFHLGRMDEAIQTYKLALEQRPDSPVLLNNLGNAYFRGGNSQEAELHYRQALTNQPDYIEATINLASLMLNRSQAMDAEQLLANHSEMQRADLQNLLGQIYQMQDKTSAARSAYQSAMRLQPEHPLWALRQMAVCPIIAPSLRSIKSWRNRLERALDQCEPLQLENHLETLATSHAQPPYHLAYQGFDNLAIKRKWASLFRCDAPKRSVRKDKPISIGFVVTSGHEGIFLTCTLGIIKQWGSSKSQLTIIAPKDAIRILRGQIKNPKVAWREMAPRFEDMVESIRNDAFDLLYFWEVGSDSANYFMPFFRLAPVQCTSWGTADTTGTPQIDTYLSSRLWEDESAQVRYSEKLVLLDRIPTCFFRPVDPGPADREGLGFAADQHIYLCAQNLFKIHPDCDGLFADLLNRDPKGRIILVEGKQSNWTELLKKRLQDNMGECFERVTFLPRQDYQSYLRLVKSADVMLDSLHFSGGNTSYEALGLAVPVVTLPGSHIRGRFTLGCYRTIDMDECIATDEEDYINKAMAIAGDPAYREALSQKIRSGWDQLFDDRLAALEFEHKLRDLAEAGPLD